MSSLTGMSVAIPFPMWMKHGLPRPYTPRATTPNSRKRLRQRSTGWRILAADLYVIGIPCTISAFPVRSRLILTKLCGANLCVWTREFCPTNPLYCRKMFIITARGDSGFEPGERNEKLNYQDPYLRTLFDSLASPTSPLFMLRMTSLVAQVGSIDRGCPYPSRSTREVRRCSNIW